MSELIESLVELLDLIIVVVAKMLLVVAPSKEAKHSIARFGNGLIELTSTLLQELAGLGYEAAIRESGRLKKDMQWAERFAAWVLDRKLKEN